MADNALPEEDIRYLKEIVYRAENKIQRYRRILLIWSVVIPVCGLGSQLLIRLARTSIIPFLWIPFVSAGIILSSIMARKIKKITRINSLLAGFQTILWLGGTAVLLLYFILAAVFKTFPLEYFPALSFPVIGLCLLATSALFRSKTGYIISGFFFLSAVPAVIFSYYAMLIQSAVMGIGLLILGISKNE